MPGFWTCCTCLHGLHQIDIHTECLQCGHQRCPSCPVDNRDADMSLHSCHEMSPYPSTPAHSACAHSLDAPRHRHVPSMMDCRNPIPQPLSVFGDVRRPFLQDLAGQRLPEDRAQTRGNLYFCCQCGDGPKLYQNQPRYLRLRCDVEGYEVPVGPAFLAGREQTDALLPGVGGDWMELGFRVLPSAASVISVGVYCLVLLA
ncbi:hypothetical protein BO82DRAFT_389762 [Aspergillus uvarum CBS 121591]|uniref:Uncharacterized protein n=1 Tax=Aspergillus uvarum CBS 121591 TaxID=1448315 RepID=A0A319E0Y1_9EURO|nr:hypothetical protein BO82DRAFT_389762 [Aspergillus uvarum CBS 121591]PYH84732.1 hypothetical protein BO82DRAFT_389762 [Aspergillus uvarum CBS 121591]